MITRLTSSIRGAMASALGLALACTFATGARTAETIPTRSGFSGYVNLGAGGLSMKTNMVASIVNGKVDVGDKRIDNLSNDPGNSEGGAIPSLNFELAYTFGSTGTQVHIGNLLDNYITMEMNTLAGVRQDVGNAGLIGASVQTTSVDTKVWSDPYLTGSRRNDTDRTADGFSLYWQQFMSSGLALKFTSSEVDIDKERSGESLVLTQRQRKSLDRNGEVYRYQLSYEFVSADNHHAVTPGLAYIDRDLDGDAMSHDGGRVSVNYTYTPDKRWRYVFNAMYGDFDFDNANPIYAREDSIDSYGVSATVFYNEPFGWKDWSFNSTAGWYEDDHEIDFYDSSVGIVMFGMLRRF